MSFNLALLLLLLLLLLLRSLRAYRGRPPARTHFTSASASGTLEPPPPPPPPLPLHSVWPWINPPIATTTAISETKKKGKNKAGECGGFSHPFRDHSFSLLHLLLLVF